MLSEGNSLLFEPNLNQSIILRKNIRVKSSKLPSDFFANPQISRYSPRKMSLKRSIAGQNTRQTNTPLFERHQNLNMNFPSPTLSKNRKIGTARVALTRDDNLIKDVITTTNNMKRVIRKKSLELVRQSFQRQQMELHLPQIKTQKRESSHF